MLLEDVALLLELLFLGAYPYQIFAKLLNLLARVLHLPRVVLDLRREVLGEFLGLGLQVSLELICVCFYFLVQLLDRALLLCSLFCELLDFQLVLRTLPRQVLCEVVVEYRRIQQRLVERLVGRQVLNWRAYAGCCKVEEVVLLASALLFFRGH